MDSELCIWIKTTSMKESVGKMFGRNVVIDILFGEFDFVRYIWKTRKDRREEIDQNHVFFCLCVFSSLSNSALNNYILKKRKMAA